MSANDNSHLDLGHFRRHASSIRGRARRSNTPFDIDAEYLREIWTGICPVFGTELRLPGFGDIAGRPKQTCSLDRLQPHLGYTKGNVVWISHFANAIKTNATTSEVMDVALWMQSMNIPELKDYDDDEQR